MALVDTLASSGDWLFRRRSYLPLVLFVPVLLEVSTSPHAALRALSPAWGAACFAVGLLGLLIRVLTVGHAPDGTSGRNTHGQVAEVLNTTGLYSLVRHPLYIGNTLMWLGPALLPGSWQLVLAVLFAIALFYERIIAAEERFLQQRFGVAFEEWAQRTATVWPFPPRPPLATPGPRWRAPALPFSWRSVARREYSGLYGLVASFVVVELVAAFATYRRLSLGRGWIVVFVAGSIIYLVLRTLKRRTRLLRAPGR